MYKNGKLTPERISFLAEDVFIAFRDEDEEMTFSGDLEEYTDFIRWAACRDCKDKKNKDKKNAAEGLKFLLDNQERFNLNCEYNDDMETVFIQLTDKKDGKTTVFNGADIFRQIYEWSVKEL